MQQTPPPIRRLAPATSIQGRNWALAALLVSTVLSWATESRAQTPAPTTEAPAASTPAPALPAPVAATPPPATPPAAAPRTAWSFEPSAQVRLRGEARVNNYAPLYRQDEYFVTSRIRVGLRASWNRLRLFAQAQDVRNLGDSTPGNDGGSQFGIHQGYAEVGFEHGYVRLGRQEIAYGSERFLGSLDWLSQARSFDGARLHLTPSAKIEFDAFGAITRGPNRFVDPMMVSHSTFGDYFAASQLAYVHSPALRLEANYFYRHYGATATAPTLERDIHAPTLRAAGNYQNGLFRYDVEATVQTGQTNTGHHFAYAFVSDFWARLGGATRPTLDAGATYATGTSSNRHVDELDNLFPTNHKFYGFMDLIGLRNSIQAHVGITHRFASPNVTIGARGYEYWLQTTNANARWSNAVGATLGNGQGGSRHLGTSADFFATYKPFDFMSITGGYSIFAPGSAASAMGHGDPQHWMWLQVDVFTP